MGYDEKTGIGLLKKYKIRDEKIKHCINVAKISRFLAQKLKEKGIKINESLVYFSAIVHDIGYLPGSTEKQRINHAKIGAEILKKEGFENVYDIVLKHDIKYWLSEKYKPSSWEEKIVNYSDSREKNGIVSLNKREKKLIEFLPEAKEWLTKAFKEVLNFEKELFDLLGMNPDDLKKFVRLD